MPRGLSSLEDAKRAAERMRRFVPLAGDDLAILPSQEHILLVSVAALVGLAAGLAATTLRIAVRLGHVVFFRGDLLWEALALPASATRQALRYAYATRAPDVEVLVLGLVALTGFSLYGLSRHRRPRAASLPAKSRAFLVGVLLGAAAVVHYSLGMLVVAVDVLNPGHEFALSDAHWWSLLIVAVVGGVLVSLFLRRHPEANTEGVPYVMEGAALHDGRLSFVAGTAHAASAAMTVAANGSCGLEGPVVVFGASSASGLGQALHLSRDRLRVLVAAGAAAGIAASFNAPIAGALFALEIVVGDFALTTFSPVVMASVVGTVVHRSIEGDHPVFAQAHFDIFSGYENLLYVLLGLTCGLVGTLFVRTLEGTRRLAERTLGPVPEFLRPAVGLSLVAAVAMIFGRPEILGPGYGTVHDLLNERVLVSTAVLILACKMIATSLTLGTGGIGGVFMPSLMLGAATGTAFGSAAQQLLGDRIANPGSYALVGMGAVLTAVQQAPLTACVMIFELCNNYFVMVPLLVACITSTLLSLRSLRESFYERVLREKGVVLSRGKGAFILQRITVGDAMNTEVVSIHEATHLIDIERIVAHSTTTTFPVVDDEGRLAGVLSIQDLRPFLMEANENDALIIARDLGTRKVITIDPGASLLEALNRLAMQPFEHLVVTDPSNRHRVVGLLSHHAVVAAYKAALQREGLFGRPLKVG